MGGGGEVVVEPQVTQAGKGFIQAVSPGLGGECYGCCGSNQLTADKTRPPVGQRAGELSLP